MSETTSSGASATAPPVEARANGDGHRRLVATDEIAADAEIVALEGTVRSSPSRFSIQIGPGEHLDDMGPVNSTNHGCDPNAFVDFSDPRRPVLRALRDVAPGEEITIHYCATEYDMSEPFACDCGAAACVGRVRGYRYLSPDAAAALAPLLSPAIRELVQGPRAD